MKLKSSLVSVILPVYNAAGFLPQCLESLMNQSYNELEIIAIDDKSKDHSLKVLKEFKRRFAKNNAHKNHRINIYQNKKHYGQSICLNRAIKLAQGQYVAFMNPYDYIARHKIQRQVNYLAKNPRTVALGTQFATVNLKLKIIEKSALPQNHEEIYNALLHSSPLKPETVIINRLLLPKDLLIFSSNKYPLLFNELFIKLAQYGKIANLGLSYYNHRIGIRRYMRKSGKIKHAFSLLQIFLKSRSSYDYRPSLRISWPALIRNA